MEQHFFTPADHLHATSHFMPTPPADTQGTSKHQAGYMRMESSRFDFSKLEHIEQLTSFLADCFASPTRALVGITELMVNALEYGILNITPYEKTSWVTHQCWRKEIMYRQTFARYANKSASVIFTRRQEGCYISICDPGKGFKWQDHLAFDPARSGNLSGRGIAQAVASFDRLAYNQEGNEVVGFIATTNSLQW